MKENVVCYRCKTTFRDHHNLQQHYDRKKKCTPLGTLIDKPRWFCEPCKRPFSNKSHHTAHLKTRTHARMTGSTHIVTNSTNTKVNSIEINFTPCDVSRLDYEYLPSLSATELKRELGLDSCNFQRTIANTFRALHLNDRRTANHNIFLESSRSDKALIHKAGSWRLEDRKRALYDCICQCTVHLLDLEGTIKQCMDEKTFKRFCLFRDDIERESARESDRLIGLLENISDQLAKFSAHHFEAIQHAKVQASKAAPLVYKLSQRFQEWLQGGRRYEEARENLYSTFG